MILPYPVLERVITQKVEHMEATQRNNHLVATSVLKSAVVSFLQFERSFKSLLSKGDDGTQIAILKHAITELRAANQSFDSMLERGDALRSFIVEPTYVVNLRELFEHCIKILSLVLQLLGQREVRTNSYEYAAQTYGWKGWQQISEQVSLSNNVLTHLLKHKRADFEVTKLSIKHDADLHYRSVVQEILLFSLSVTHMTERFFECKYPTKAHIVKIYETAGSEIHSYLTLHDTSNVAVNTTTTYLKEAQPVANASWF